MIHDHILIFLKNDVSAFIRRLDEEFGFRIGLLKSWMV